MDEKKSYIISYDMAGNGDYDALIKHIKAYGYWAHITESTWAVLSAKTAAEIRNDILNYLTDGSRLIVVQSANVAAWNNTMCSNDWLIKNV